HLVQVGGRENERDTRRRFFESLEQRVERRARQHVYFVDDEDLVAVPGGCDGDRVYDHLADVFYRRIRSRVDLDDVDRTRTGDLDARRTLAAGFDGDPLQTVEGLCQDSRGCGFAHAASPGEKICVMKAAGAERVCQSSSDDLLPDDLREG